MEPTLKLILNRKPEKILQNVRNFSQFMKICPHLHKNRTQDMETDYVFLSFKLGF